MSRFYNNDILDFELEKLIKRKLLSLALALQHIFQIFVKILRFKKWPSYFENIIFMFQKELGEKILGKYLKSNYGRLSILSSYRLNCIKKFYVSQNCFFPGRKLHQWLYFLPIHKKYTKLKIY